MQPPRVQALAWTDPPLGEMALPGETLRLTLGVGSGLSRRPGDPPGRLWGLGDRGPNFKIDAAVEQEIDAALEHEIESSVEAELTSSITAALGGP